MLTSWGGTDVGLKRANNEDGYLVLPEQGIFVVADGMGGAASGEIASRIFIDTVNEVFETPHHQGERTTAETLRETFMKANDRILQRATEDPTCKGMGCTAEILALRTDRYIVGHVGDSRTYLLRNGAFHQITRDHSLVQAQIDSGILTVEAAKNHALRHIILKAVGIDAPLEVDVTDGATLKGDLFLLCSDGLTDMIDDAEIYQILTRCSDLKKSVDNLIEAAKWAGGKDNITAVLCKVP